MENIMGDKAKIKSVAVVGAGAAGAITAAALHAENYFETIRVFERREAPGGTWIFDPDPQPNLELRPGRFPPDVDPPLRIPDQLPRITAPNQQERFSKTPIYASLTTNVPDVAMCFSDQRFAYGPFAPHWVPRQYVESYFAHHKTDPLLSLSTTVEDVSKLPHDRWKLTLRKYDSARHVDVWWEEEFDALILANGHYSVPYVPQVKGLEEYLKKFPGRVLHSKYYRSPLPYISKKIVIIGNSASGHDLTAELVSTASLPVYQSRRSKSRWDGDEPPAGIAWKPIISEYVPETGRIIFEDGTYLDDVDTVFYCTGYKASFPFWNESVNGRPLWDYTNDKLHQTYWHTFFRDFPTLGAVGVPRALTFRSFEYQAVALARLFSGRNTASLPPLAEQERWERNRLQDTKRRGKKFHDVPWENGQTLEWLGGLFDIAGLGTLRGEGRIPPALTQEIVWAIEHLRKYPEPGKGKDKDKEIEDKEAEWVLVDREQKDLLAFI
ncbi:putative dimethylaniline monooxygenase [Hypoxylon trugodes]|uniref:putative dimethylaniline monooxygenase n=1 Tax=Hypoxylon trugodes TaxID=326681 RepID=UPI0021A16705|nr:putative dimethylaniline monooxygenase [Hypoxylon trugodes]KAI1392150.1 putative dimethylaniline monooxygenase [Hypoxylon trugodes]